MIEKPKRKNGDKPEHHSAKRGRRQLLWFGLCGIVLVLLLIANSEPIISLLRQLGVYDYVSVCLVYVGYAIAYFALKPLLEIRTNTVKTVAITVIVTLLIQQVMTQPVIPHQTVHIVTSLFTH